MICRNTLEYDRDADALIEKCESIGTPAAHDGGAYGGADVDKKTHSKPSVAKRGKDRGRPKERKKYRIKRRAGKAKAGGEGKADDSAIGAGGASSGDMMKALAGACA